MHATCPTGNHLICRNIDATGSVRHFYTPQGPSAVLELIE